MEDEWASCGVADSSDVWQGANQDLPCLFNRDVAASENKGTYAGQLQGDSLEPPIADALISSEDNPAFPARALQSDFVGSALGKVIGKALDQSATATQCGRDRIAVQRFVQKKPDCLRLP